jgi:hypothetical protein
MEIIKTCQKLIILWDKKKFLTLLEMESGFLKAFYSRILERDINELRKKLGEIRALKNPSNIKQQEATELEADINETIKYRQMIKDSSDKSLDLRRQIDKYKKELWS